MFENIIIMKNKLISILILSILISTNVMAQDTGRFSMQDVVFTTDNNYPQLQMYESKIASIRQ